MIYIQLDNNVKPIDFSKKKEVMEFGKSNYSFEGTGQVFYKEILKIRKSADLYHYIHEHLKKDFYRWKNTIKKISKYDEKVKNFIDTNLK